MIEEWISYKWDQTIYSYELWRIEEHVWYAGVRKVDMKKVDKPWIIPMSLCFLLAILESRYEIPFKAGRVVTPWNFQFQDVNRE
jgi:hypothetical protein